MVRKWAPQTQPGLDADVMLYRETRLRGGGQARGTAETTPSVSHAKRRRRVANSCKSVSECTQCVFSSSSSKYSAGLSRRHGVHNGTMQTSMCAPESCPPYSTDSRLPELPSGSVTLTSRVTTYEPDKLRRYAATLTAPISHHGALCTSGALDDEPMSW